MVLFESDFDGINALLQEEGVYTKSNYTESWVEGPEKTRFYTRLYPAAGTPIASVVFVHGFQEHITRYDHVFNRVAKEGNVDVFAFDQRGWGRTVLDTENKSPEGSYGLTRRRQQLADLEFFLQKEFERVGPSRAVYLWGHSMGGGLVLSFATAKNGLPSKETILRLSGLICSAPLIKQGRPAAKPLRLAGALLSRIIPWAPFPAEVPNKDLTTNERVNAEAKADPLMKTYASIGIINDILAAGDQLYAEEHRNWPATLPLLMTHGSEDHICSPAASRYFFDHVPLANNHKTYMLFEGAYHELHNEPKWWKDDVDATISFIKVNLNNPSVIAKL